MAPAACAPVRQLAALFAVAAAVALGSGALTAASHAYGGLRWRRAAARPQRREQDTPAVTASLILTSALAMQAYPWITANRRHAWFGMFRVCLRRLSTGVQRPISEFFKLKTLIFINLSCNSWPCGRRPPATIALPATTCTLRRGGTLSPRRAFAAAFARSACACRGRLPRKKGPGHPGICVVRRK